MVWVHSYGLFNLMFMQANFPVQKNKEVNVIIAVYPYS